MYMVFTYIMEDESYNLQGFYESPSLVHSYSLSVYQYYKHMGSYKPDFTVLYLAINAIMNNSKYKVSLHMLDK